MGMLPFAVYAACAVGTGYINPIAQPGEPGYTPEPKNHFRFMFENDSPSGLDRNYTHGTRVDYARVMDNGHVWGVSLVQNMYTPEVHTDHNVQWQHPYCGYMAFGGAFLWRAEQFGWGAELQVGFVGNASCAGRFQNVLHDAFNMPKWDGWKDQVPSEVTMELTTRQEWALPCMQGTLWGPWQVDSAFVLRESVGSVRISGGSGFTFRVGRNLPPTTQTVGNTPTSFNIGLIRKPNYNPLANSYFLVVEMYADYVARDISVDGGIFHHFDRTCTRTPWQLEGRAGVGVRRKSIDYYVGLLVYSRTYKTQDKNSALGTFSISWNW